MTANPAGLPCASVSTWAVLARAGCLMPQAPSPVAWGWQRRWRMHTDAGRAEVRASFPNSQMVTEQAPGRRIPRAGGGRDRRR